MKLKSRLLWMQWKKKVLQIRMILKRIIKTIIRTPKNTLGNKTSLPEIGILRIIYNKPQIICHKILFLLTKKNRRIHWIINNNYNILLNRKATEYKKNKQILRPKLIWCSPLWRIFKISRKTTKKKQIFTTKNSEPNKNWWTKKNLLNRIKKRTFGIGN